MAEEEEKSFETFHHLFVILHPSDNLPASLL
jgi:hypothetical protein